MKSSDSGAGFLEALKITRTARNFGDRTDKVRFVLGFTGDEEAVLNVTDHEGRPCLPDYRNFSGAESVLLRSISMVRQSQRFNITWGSDSEEGISIPDNRHIVYQMLECPELYLQDDGSGSREGMSSKRSAAVKKLSVDRDRIWTLTCHISKDCRPVFSLVSGEESLSCPLLITDSFALAEDTVVRIEPVGENFQTLRHFRPSFQKPLLERYVSVLCSTLDNVKVECEDETVITDSQPLTAKPAIVIEKVDADSTLYLRVVQSLPGIDPDFLHDFQLSRVAVRTGENELTVRPLMSADIESACSDLYQQISHSSPSKSLSKEIYRDSDTFIIPAHTAEQFLFGNIQSLARTYRILGADKLKGYKIRPVQPKLNVKIGSGIDFLEADASVDIQGEQFTLADFLRLYRKDSYVVLSDGDRAIIDETYVRKLERLFSKGKKKDGFKVSFFDLPEVSALLDEVPQGRAMERSRKFYEGFNSLSSSHLRLGGIKAELRPYQKDGVKWMKYLYDNSMGGCLADDMGLGKTIQTIALLASVYAKGQTLPTLVVMPKSLIFNWTSELSRFAPQLSLCAYYGTQREIGDISSHQVVLTSYGMVRSDIEKLRDIDFHMVILDESQNIRNVSAQMTQAVLMLKAEKRFALSGTPVENNLSELYSLFRFLNPAMFGTMQEFSDRYATPIHKDSDTEILEELRRKIYPFLLRRTKGEVLRDLPERIDQKIYVDMSPQHASFYEQRRRYFSETIHQGIAENGIGKSQLVILQALSELRRIASIPESMSDRAVASSKIPVLMESLEEAVANRHKCVVFFNFIAGIEIVGEMLESSGIGYAVMTGATQDRESVVRCFQSDESCRVLLMTLKTGGVGLNLTAADTVYIFEPWWNKAEEEQAIGRLHRIGQKSTVMTFSIITRGTIEEKIALLQDQKSQLVDALISSDGRLGKQFTEEEIDFILK